MEFMVAAFVNANAMRDESSQPEVADEDLCYVLQLQLQFANNPEAMNGWRELVKLTKETHHQLSKYPGNFQVPLAAYTGEDA